MSVHPVERRREPKAPASEDAGLALSKGGLDLAAKMYAKTGQLPPMGMGAAGAKVRSEVISRAAELRPDTDSFHAQAEGQAAPDLAANKAKYHANEGALAQLTKNRAAVDAFASTAQKNGQLLDGILKKLPDTGVTFLNKPLRSMETALGNTEMSAFNVLRQSVQTEYARAINNPNLI